MSKLTREEVLAVADRAMLELTDEEADMYAEELSTFINYADKLNELNTDHVEPMTHVLQQKNVMREDVVQDVLAREEMLAGVKEHKDGEIKVPTILS
ncbi:Asp-tRNA(Asn)/Glu-tRNA(Gln) amidotransferase subunit GatC [Sporosarcina pasteurii]|uniref:Aspartyl/glutamyl-tRNA(Asn/Gln) amidotransferase subunit C n=1 Tax=Sporosarcina pasteurii TaxID=1474 RepID=A0A380CBM4_SPOPA|nr:Asp-tRNA(Asn)/Glu-tRNA(Gln) amidotransferase subunit GatC [Sporosarcina pasteurii]MDS9473141.1 Asp-tRNA(Asn)/Glu-tRNA(Gln) amidotransferase subunit GatC [Sporosarcina pasteurii]QBQ04214.1 Asp-tRNA(Asn)/Glu-tRNA(Gln) amidotransferase subunit GatC [Sporosarcina pasteurii]SUJ17326.1 Aspartyl/glutamyl-tRNA(Asn/Gln) amidotransferase subunit C [Sporosarcina pasteurii]